MNFVSDIGRPWTLQELERANMLAKNGHEVAYIAALLNRSVSEIKAVFG